MEHQVKRDKRKLKLNVFVAGPAALLAVHEREAAMTKVFDCLATLAPTQRADYCTATSPSECWGPSSHHDVMLCCDARLEF